MPDTTLRLTDQKVLSHADNCLPPHLPLEAEGYACMTDDLLKVLLGVATNQGTIEKTIVHREPKESLAASGELGIHSTMIPTINYERRYYRGRISSPFV
jgi:hypothetical protein